MEKLNVSCSSLSCVFYLFLYLNAFFSGFQHFSLAVVPQDNGPQRPLGGHDVQNTVALQRTGVYTEDLPANRKYYLIFL